MQLRRVKRRLRRSFSSGGLIWAPITTLVSLVVRDDGAGDEVTRFDLPLRVTVNPCELVRDHAKVCNGDSTSVVLQPLAVARERWLAVGF